MTWYKLKDYWIASTAVEYSDEAGTFYVAEIPAKTYVDRVAIVVTTAWAGTSPTLDVGDSADADIWIDNSDVTQGTIGVYYGDGEDASQYLGHYYSSATSIRITLGGTDLTAGEAYALIHCLPLADIV